MKKTAAVGTIVITLGLGAEARAQDAFAGAEFQVNTYTTSNQEVPAVASDSVGNFVIVWQSLTQDGDATGIFGQRFDNTGATQGTEFPVNMITADVQEKPAVTYDGKGNFIAVWESHNYDGSAEGVAGQRFDSAGAAIGTEFQANTYTTGAQEHATVGADAMGNFVMLWDSDGQDGSAEGIFGQRFSSTGAPVGTEFQANTYTTNEQEDPDVAMDGAGNFVVVWYSGCGDSFSCIGGQDGDRDGAFGRRFSSNGSALGTEFQINTYTRDNQADPKVAMDALGNFVVAWQSFGEDGSSDGIFAQRFNATGARIGTEFQVNTYTTGSQENPRIASDPSGNFAVVWTSRGVEGNSNDGVAGQRFSSSGERVGTEFIVNTYTTRDQSVPAIASSSNNFVVTWQSYQDGDLGGIFARRLREITPPQSAPALSARTLVFLTAALLVIGVGSLRRIRRRALPPKNV